MSAYSWRSAKDSAGPDVTRHWSEVSQRQEQRMLGSLLEMQMYVAVLAEEGSFLRAAQRLHISQSILTRKIARLELV